MSPDGDALSDFELFFQEYPKHTCKKAAKKEWQKNINKPPLGKILEALTAQKRNKAGLKAAGQFCPEWPDPQRWIKNERWNDELIPIQQKSEVKQTPYVECPRCHAEVFRDDFVVNGGVKYCPKCPEIQNKDRGEAKQQFAKLTELAAGVGRPVPAVGG